MNISGIFSSKLKTFISFFLLLTLFSCSNRNIQRISGNAFGTTYSITYIGKETPELKRQIDSILACLSGTFSIFDSTSAISAFNRGETIVPDADFLHILDLSKQISTKTDGVFDCTIQPLVELWGFGKQGIRHVVNDDTLSEVRNHTGFQLVDIQNDNVVKKDSLVQLNFNAIAKGYAVDRIADFIEQKGYRNCLVEIGGEVSARGSKNGNSWKVGIQIPCENADDAAESFKTLDLEDHNAIATSGNYRNYFEENGKRYTHILDPRTGTPERTNLLSVSVMAPDCATADAYATAFMVLGLNNSSKIVRQDPQLEAWFVVAKDDGWDLIHVK